MRLSVYLLREKGYRLPPADARASAPYEGFLRVSRAPGGRVGQWARTAMLFANEGGDELLVQLHNVQLQSWDSRGVVIAGTEIHWDRKQRTDYRQTWFIVFPARTGGVMTRPPASFSAGLLSSLAHCDA